MRTHAKTQVIASIPFAEANEDLLYHVLCTFTPEQLHELAKTHNVRESRNKYMTALNIAEHKDRINATLDVLG